MTSKISATTSGLTESVDTSGALEFQTNGASALIINTDQSANFTGNTALVVPVGTTAQRPTPVNGMLRYNTTLATFETYANNAWGAFTLSFPPTSNTAPVISGANVASGTTLSTTNGTWNNTPTSYAYQWLANASAIGGATANTFTLTNTQVGANITCNVTATNAVGNATATSNSLGPVILNPNFAINYLVVGGGGGGGPSGPPGGGPSGGGAGGYLANTTTFTVGTTYTMTVGAGAGTSGTGSNSVLSGANISTVTSYGGGYGGSWQGSGGSGGSGGGGGSLTAWGDPPNTTYGGSGTAGQGNSGGNSSNYFAGGGGGGAGAAGTSGPGGGNGGDGLQSSITGSAVYYAGGGGGANYTPGQGGGGNPNTGGGGTGSSGGSGVVIISMPTSRYSGTYTGSNVVVTTSGSNTIVKFNSSGTYTA